MNESYFLYLKYLSLPSSTLAALGKVLHADYPALISLQIRMKLFYYSRYYLGTEHIVMNYTVKYLCLLGADTLTVETDNKHINIKLMLCYYV